MPLIFEEPDEPMQAALDMMQEEAVRKSIKRTSDLTVAGDGLAEAVEKGQGLEEAVAEWHRVRTLERTKPPSVN